MTLFRQQKPQHAELILDPGAPPRRWAVWLATGLGVGYGPVMPGTYGSVLGVGLYLVMVQAVKSLPFAFPLLCVDTLVITVLSVHVVSIALRSFRVQDPQEIVLDEIVGQMITLLPLPLVPQNTTRYWYAVIAGFVLFRALDASKPYPVWKLERLKGAWGIIADDVGAGVLGALLLSGAIAWGWRI